MIYATYYHKPLQPFYAHKLQRITYYDLDTITTDTLATLTLAIVCALTKLQAKHVRAPYK